MKYIQVVFLLIFWVPGISEKNAHLETMKESSFCVGSCCSVLVCTFGCAKLCSNCLQKLLLPPTYAQRPFQKGVNHQTAFLNKLVFQRISKTQSIRGFATNSKKRPSTKNRCIASPSSLRSENHARLTPAPPISML